MIITNDTPPSTTFQEVGPGQAFIRLSDGAPLIRHNTGTGSTNLATGGQISLANGEPVVIAENATVSMFPPA